MLILSLLSLVLLAYYADAQGTAQTLAGIGGVAATTCGSATACGTGGSSNYASRSFIYNVTSGVFTGTLTSNGCPDVTASVSYPNPTANCFTFSFPRYSWPSATPFGGPIAFLLNGGYIYNGQEAGFSAADNAGLCNSAPTAFCAGGMAISICVQSLNYTCGLTSAAAATALMTSYNNGGFAGDQSCGFHANPLHTHGDALCEYSRAASGHSPLIGISLDGYGIYGLYESSQTAPTDLNSCNLHIGQVPGTASAAGALLSASSVATNFGSSAGTTVPHYHTSLTWPFTIGCYGQLNYSQCAALSPNTCNTWQPVQNSQGIQYVDDWCTCGLPNRALPITSPGQLPQTLSTTLSSPMCYPTLAGNSRAPTSTTGTVACSSCTAATCVGVSSVSPPPSPPSPPLSSPPPSPGPPPPSPPAPPGGYSPPPPKPPPPPSPSPSPPPVSTSQTVTTPSTSSAGCLTGVSAIALLACALAAI